MASEIEQAIKFVCEEKGLSYDAVMETLETALAAAYRKDYGNKQQNIEIEFDPATGDMKAFDVKEVVEDIPLEVLEALKEKQAQEAAEREAEMAAKGKVVEEKREKVGKEKETADSDKEEVKEGEEAAEGEEEEDEGPSFNPKTEIMVSDAQVLKMGSVVGDVLRIDLPIPGDFGRMAAMTAKQVITQKLREAEREIIFNEYKEQEGEVLIGTVQRKEGRVILVDIGRTTGVLLPMDQVRSERYNSGDRVKVFVREVSLGTRGPQILLSRSSIELVRSLFMLEVPEIADGTVEIKKISREAGSRTKIAVATEDESIDPIGACIGQRGVRIQTIISELGGEKIDVIEWNDDPKTFIVNALSPAKIADVDMDEEAKEATVIVEKDQLSLAIGRGGQNVRLAAQLTEWKLNVREAGADADGGAEEEATSDSEEAQPDKEATNEAETSEEATEAVTDTKVEETEVEADETSEAADASDTETTPEESEPEVEASADEKEEAEGDE